MYGMPALIGSLPATTARRNASALATIGPEVFLWLKRIQRILFTASPAANYVHNSWVEVAGRHYLAGYRKDAPPSTPYSDHAPAFMFTIERRVQSTDIEARSTFISDLCKLKQWFKYTCITAGGFVVAPPAGHAAPHGGMASHMEGPRQIGA